MAHRFTIHATINGVSITDFKRLAKDTTLHEAVCKRIPGENLQILESVIQGDIYTLKRAYNLDVNIPEIAKKLLKDAFRLKRTDVTNLETLISTVELGANLPLEASCQRSITGNAQQLNIQLDWQVKVKVPLVGGMLEKHAEGEIRKFSDIEIGIVEDELKKNLK
ncbi:DUF2505 family protein [Acinetobacter wuhouensis]|uniref:DUF2505 family protein n=1 Tax=Acinetobacter wuhouensis TaxID=1879050 RepID=UPI001022DB21|nr:DUF2505 family protein [Acinetobacter wuhouensis]RZG74226.1 DUF2505 family protein [Acinetobacter wuhouensis]